MTAANKLLTIGGQYQGRCSTTRQAGIRRKRCAQVTLKSLPARGPSAAGAAKQPGGGVLGSLRRMYVRRGSSCKANNKKSSPPRKLTAAEIDNDALSDDETVSVMSANDDHHFDLEDAKQERTTIVHFCPTVQIMQIPDRHAYTAKEKARIWRTRKQIRLAAKRNLFEFAWEGRDWQTVVDERNFVLRGGKLVHPAHGASDEDA